MGRLWTIFGRTTVVALVGSRIPGTTAGTGRCAGLETVQPCIIYDSPADRVHSVVDDEMLLQDVSVPEEVLMDVDFHLKWDDDIMQVDVHLGFLVGDDIMQIVAPLKVDSPMMTDPILPYDDEREILLPAIVVTPPSPRMDVRDLR